MLTGWRAVQRCWPGIFSTWRSGLTGSFTVWMAAKFLV